MPYQPSPKFLHISTSYKTAFCFILITLCVHEGNAASFTGLGDLPGGLSLAKPMQYLVMVRSLLGEALLFLAERLFVGRMVP